jgi:hypothetical protein
MTQTILDHLVAEGDIVVTDDGGEPAVVSDMVARVESASRPLVRP